MSNLFIETQRRKQEELNRKHMGFHRHQNRIRELEEKGNSGYDWSIVETLKKREKKDKTVSNVLSRDDADNEYSSMLSNFGIGVTDNIRQYAHDVLGSESDAYRIRLLTKYTEEILNKFNDSLRSNGKSKVEVFK